MTQPVIDTLQVSNVLKNTGMAPEQAEEIARVLGAELGAHVVVQKDLESGFQGVRSDLGTEIQKVRTDLGTEIQKVRTDLGAEIQKFRTDLGAEIQKLRTDLGAEIRELDAKVVGIEGRMDGMDRKIEALNWKLTFIVGGFGLLLSVLTVASGMGFFERTPPSPQPYSHTAPHPPSPSMPPVSAPTATPPTSP